MNLRDIVIPESVKAEAKKQAGQIPVMLTAEDRKDFLADIPPAIRGDAEIHWNALVELGERQVREIEILNAQATKDALRQILVFSKPLLTLQEAAEFLSVSPKRLTNILYEEKARRGKFPEFVCDAGGILQRRFIKDSLIDWAKHGNKKRGGRTGK